MPIPKQEGFRGRRRATLEGGGREVWGGARLKIGTSTLSQMQPLSSSPAKEAKDESRLHRQNRATQNQAGFNFERSESAPQPTNAAAALNHALVLLTPFVVHVDLARAQGVLPVTPRARREGLLRDKSNRR